MQCNDQRRPANRATLHGIHAMAAVLLMSCASTQRPQSTDPPSSRAAQSAELPLDHRSESPQPSAAPSASTVAASSQAPTINSQSTIPRDLEAESAARSIESESYIPAGTYVLGPYDFCAELNRTTRRMEGRGPNCEVGYFPAKMVTLRAFYIDRAEVTVAEYDQCVKAKVCKRITPAMLKEFPTPCSDPKVVSSRLPGGAMSCVNHDEATTYCGWKGKRLPTDSEWETAARGGDSRTFPWGDEFPQTETETREKLCISYRPCPVRKFGPYGPFRLFGMESGVREWTSNPACDSDPQECSPGHFGVHGGAYSDSRPSSWDVFSTGGVDGLWRFVEVGFRCARDAQ